MLFFIFYCVLISETVRYEMKSEVQDIINPEPTATGDDNNNSKKSSTQSCQANFGNYVVIGLIVSLITFLLIGIISNANNGVIDKNGNELGAIIGLTVLNMFITPILLWTIGYRIGITCITENTSKCVLILWLLILIVDFICLATYLPNYSFFYIFYVVIKIILMPQFYVFGEIDMKWFGSGVIQSYIKDDNFLKNESKVLRLWPWVVCVIVLQMCLFILGCLAFVGDINKSFEVKIILFCLLIWSIKVLTHLLHYIFGRMITFSIDEKSRINKQTNSSKFLQRVTRASTRMINTKTVTDPETHDTQSTLTATAIQTGLL